MVLTRQHAAAAAVFVTAVREMLHLTPIRSLCEIAV